MPIGMFFVSWFGGNEGGKVDFEAMHVFKMCFVRDRFLVCFIKRIITFTSFNCLKTRTKICS